MKSRVPRPLARRIDHLAARAHRFHRYAHHPLCGRYANEVIRIGKLRLCRGCSYAVLGGLAGGILGVAVGSAGLAAAALVASTTLLALSLRLRPPKIVTRLLPAAGAAFALISGTLSIRLAAIAVVVALRVLYGRRGPDRSPCTSCPERHLAPCSGYYPIVMRERAFQRVTARWLSDATRS
ncbi:MAG TPA: hypothetical protein VMJ10_36535 [Kofleriaceae bacterium]|nr:hypothetical protein [Kofleriaceae bacterium]